MRKSFEPRAWLYPEPVLVIGTYNEDGTANAMVAAWGAMSDYKQIFIALDLSHKTADNIRGRQAFTVSITDAAHIPQADYVGSVSGRDVPDKVEVAGLHVCCAEKVDAPYFEEFPLTFECSLAELDENKERVFGNIENITADECILDGRGRIDVEKLAPIAFDPVSHTYLHVSGKAGQAFHDGLVYKK